MRTAFSTASPTTVARTVCYFRGTSAEPPIDYSFVRRYGLPLEVMVPGDRFYRSYECIIPDATYLDRNYHQDHFVYHSGGGDFDQHRDKPDLPPGIEIKTSGRLKWFVQDPKLVSDRFSITNLVRWRKWMRLERPHMTGS